MLARSPAQKTAARDAALRLLGITDNGDYWCTRALQVLVDDLNTPSSSRSSPRWLAIAKPRRDRVAQSYTLDSSLGASLAKHPDQRVRRALAGALCGRLSQFREPTPCGSS